MQSADLASTRLAPRLARFVIGLALLALLVLFFASGYTPPGASGEVLRHNQSHDIDASPLFYTEVENMHELEDGLSELRRTTTPAGNR